MKIKAPAIIGFLLIIMVGMPTIIYLALTEQNYQSSAHIVGPHATSVCKNGFVQITFTDTISNLPKNATAKTTLSDTLGLYNGIQFTSKPGDPPMVIVKLTNQNILSQGDELIHSVTTFSDGFPTQKNDTPVPSVGPCISLTPTPTPTSGLTPTPGSSPTPSSIPPTQTPVCTVPPAVSHVKIICPNCNNQ
jgi:hypothetical protein